MATPVKGGLRSAKQITAYDKKRKPDMLNMTKSGLLKVIKRRKS